ncbi:MAG: alpha/beta fold hydrolase [Gammaproteobacteria bacterium]|nr:MAG: alpha/beta fold hydrolase [Gammaproteobacteria bacterium]
MKRKAVRLVMQLVKLLVSGLVGALIILLIGFVVALDNRPDLHVWHLAELDEEFTASSPVESFEEYLSLEDRLFRQLDERVYQKIEPSDRYLVNRYYRGSESDPDRWPVNLNRSFELSTESPRAGVLLLHGMSDSPYSLRNLGNSLSRSGAWVVGLRLPGHGTAPSGLVHVRWQDMAAAVKIAMQHLRRRVGSAPIYIVGYSNGGALAVQYSLVAMDDDSLPRADKLVLVSPAIGVSRGAVLAVWQARLGDLLRLDKLAWNSLLPEYDPYKYGSFAVNAGDQVYRLTAEIQSLFDARSEEELRRFPPVLAFQSVVDATVSAPALVKGLFSRLPENDHELVLFDINRDVQIEQLMYKDPSEQLRPVLEDTDATFDLTVLTNESEESKGIAIKYRRAGQSKVEVIKTDMKWPDDVYSVSHIALPMPVTDPLYGRRPGEESPGVSLGKLALYGERGLLRIPASDMLRQRWNPFYPYLERRVHEFMGLGREAVQ